MLERIKHLFSVNNIVFVIATDTEQLSHAVAGTYGIGFDGARYLKRFFDRSYYFPTASKQDFIATTFAQLGLENDMFSVPDHYTVLSFLTKLLDLRAIELRDIKQILDMVQTFYAVWPHEGLKIELTVLLPLIYAIHTPKTSGVENQAEMRDVVLLFPKVIDRSQGFVIQLGQEEKFHKNHVQECLDNLAQYWDDITTEISDNGNPVLTWVQQLFIQEMRLLHNNTYNPAVRPSSILKTYPDLLGRLSRLESIS